MTDPRTTLDPADWTQLRTLGHQMMDDMIDHLSTIAQQPVWQKMPDDARAHFTTPLPSAGANLLEIYNDFSKNIKPYATIQLWAEAAKKAHSIKPARVAHELRVGGPWPTVLGPIKFDAKGDVINAAYAIYKWDNGTPDLLVP